MLSLQLLMDIKQMDRQVDMLGTTCSQPSTSYPGCLIRPAYLAMLLMSRNTAHQLSHDFMPDADCQRPMAQVEVAVEITMETTTSVQRPEKTLISSSRPLISRVLLPDSADSSTSMLYKHRETGMAVFNPVPGIAMRNFPCGEYLKGLMPMPGKPH